VGVHEVAAQRGDVAVPQRQAHVQVGLGDGIGVREDPVEEEPEDHELLPRAGRDRDDPIAADEGADDALLEGGVVGDRRRRQVRHGRHRTMAG
jgi:hypothetical protein